MSYTKEYQQYVDLYDSYQESKERLRQLENNEKTASEKYRVEQAALEEIRMQHFQAQKKYNDAESKLRINEKKYASATTFQSSAIENELSRLEQSQRNGTRAFPEEKVYQIKEENTRASYEQECQKEIEKERAEAASRKKILKQKISTLRNNPNSIFEEPAFAKHSDRIYAIRRQLISYLKASKKISESRTIKTFKNNIKNAAIQESDISFSSEYLCNMLVNMAVCDYPTSNKKTNIHEARRKASRSPFPVVISVVFSCIAALFMGKYLYNNPAFESIIYMPGRILFTIIFAAVVSCIIGVIIHLIIKLLDDVIMLDFFMTVDSEVVERILDLIVIAITLFGGYKVYTDYSIIVSMILRALIILFIIVLFCAICWLILTQTVVSTLFYKTTDNVSEGLKEFEDYYNAHMFEYTLLYYFDDALRFSLIYEYRNELENLEAKLQAKEKEISDQFNADLYESLKGLWNERQKQVAAHRRREAENTQKLNSAKQRLEEQERKRITAEEKKHNDLISLKRECGDSLDRLTQKITKQEQVLQSRKLYYDKIKADTEMTRQTIIGMQQKLEELSEYYESETSLTNVFVNCNTPDGIIDSDGIFSSDLFFVLKQRDKEGLCVIKKLSQPCKPTVCLYEKSEIISTDWIELTNFVLWYSDTIRRIHPAFLFKKNQFGTPEFKFHIISPISGTSRFHRGLYDGYDGTHTPLQYFENFLLNKIKEVDSTIRRYPGIDITVSTIDDVNQSIIKKYKDSRDGYSRQINPDGIKREIVGYSVVFYIMPRLDSPTFSTEILSPQIQQCFRSCEKYGIVPIFILDRETWMNGDQNTSISFLKEIVESSNIREIGGLSDIYAMNIEYRKIH